MLQFSFEGRSLPKPHEKRRVTSDFSSRWTRCFPWEAFLSELEPFYPQGARGRPPVGFETMLRIYFMQQWFGHSDPGMEDALHDNIAMRRFARLDAGYAPDETTICKFRHWLEERGLTKRLLSISNKHLRAHGVMVREGSIVDATIISAPASTKNRTGARDPEMKSTRKANKWRFGMKAHIGTDTQGYVHSVEVTAANVHDVTMMEQCLHGEEKEIYGDKGYACRKRKEQGRVARRRLAGVAQGGQRQETDLRGRFVQSQEQPHSRARRTSLRGGQASLGLPQDALPGVAQERGAGLYAVCAGEFLHGAQEIDSCRPIGMPERPVLRRPGRKNTTISTI